MKKIISFDLDGTLMKPTFGNMVWLEGLPQVYASEKNISFPNAYEELKNEYDSIGQSKKEWYDLSYWIEKLDLSISPNELLSLYKSFIQPYPETKRVVEQLSESFFLIVTSCAMKEFIIMELQESGLNPFFSQYFSSTSDTDSVAKDPSFYQLICTQLQVSPNQIIHVGDSKALDFDAPRSIGMNAYYLSRNHAVNEKYVISSLDEFVEKIMK